MADSGFELLRKSGTVEPLARPLRSTDRLLVEDGLTDQLYYAEPADLGSAPGNIVAESFGISTTSADNADAIAAAVAALAILGGGVLNFGPGVYYTSDLLITASNVTLRGVGGGSIFSADNSGTVLRAAVGTEDLLTFSAAPAAGFAVHGSGIDGILLDGYGRAERGLVVGSVTGGRFVNFRVQGCTVTAVETIYGAGPATGLKQTYACLFDNWSLHCTGNVVGLSLGGEPAGAGGNRTTFCRFINWHIYHEDGDAVFLHDCDTNWFGFGGISRDGTGVGIHLDGTDPDGQDLVENNQFHAVHAGFGGWLAEGDQSIRNTVFGLSTTDGVPVVITDGAQLFFLDDLNKGAGWQLVAEWEFAVDGADPSLTVTGLDAYSSVMVIIDAVTLAASGFRWVKVGNNNGDSWLEAGTSWSLVDANGVVSSTGNYIQAHFTASALARTATVVIENFNIEGHKIARLGDRIWYGHIEDALDSIQVFGLAADFTTPTNFNGGTIRVYGRA